MQLDHIIVCLLDDGAVHLVADNPTTFNCTFTNNRIVLRMTWKVWACPRGIRSPGINGEGELRGQPANPGSPGKMALKTECVCVCVYSTVRSTVAYTEPGHWLESYLSVYLC